MGLQLKHARMSKNGEVLEHSIKIRLEKSYRGGDGNSRKLSGTKQIRLFAISRLDGKKCEFGWVDEKFAWGWKKIHSGHCLDRNSGQGRRRCFAFFSWDKPENEPNPCMTCDVSSGFGSYFAWGWIFFETGAQILTFSIVKFVKSYFL